MAASNMPTPPKRSESDVISKQLKLKFGDREYVVPVLRAQKAAEWRQQFFERTKKISDSLAEKFDGDAAELSKALSKGLMHSLLSFPEAIPELVFSYATSLEKDKETILAEAYDQDYVTAYQQIWGVAFAPFLASLGTVMEMQRAKAVSSSPSVAPSN